MPDLTSVLLVTVIVILTIILVIFSVQIFFILKDFRRSLKNFDRILVNLGHLSSKIDETVSSAAIITVGARIVSNLISLIHKDGERSRP